MERFKIISDSSCDLPKSITDEYSIGIIPYYVTLDSKNYYKENIDITNEVFYKRLIDENVTPKTSLPPIADYLDVFKKFLVEGTDVLCICLSSKFSGSYQSAVNAANMLREDFPDREIIVVDSGNATAGQGLIVLEAVYMREAGLTISEIADRLNKLKADSKIVFTIDSLEYLRKGGRIGLVSSLAGVILNIKPIIYLEGGELVPHSKTRGRKKAIQDVIDLTIKETGGAPDDYRFFVLSAHCIEEAEQLTDVISREYGIRLHLPISNVGVTIGAHTGPSAVGIAFIKKYTTYGSVE